MGRSDSEACPCQRHSCAWLDGSQGVAAPSKDHLHSSNTSLIALLVLMSVKHRSLRCILVVGAQTDLALQASLPGSSALGRCGPYPPLRAEMQSTIKAKGQ